MKFTLKVIDDENLGVLRSDTRHRYGGIDTTQDHAFRHIFPSGFCEWGFRSLLFDMAAIHGWDVSVRVLKREEPKS